MITQDQPLTLPQRPARQFVAENLVIKDWESVVHYFDNLLNRYLHDTVSLEKLLQDRSELEAFIAEDLAWRYIHMTCYTDNAEYAQQYQFFVTNIQPLAASYTDKLNQKILACPFLQELKQKKGYFILIRELQKEAEIFRQENVPLLAEAQVKAQKYSEVTGAMTVIIEGKEQTLPQASRYLKLPERSLRQEAYHLIHQRRLQDAETINQILSDLIKIRHQIAQNAGFENFRDYTFKAKSRFDYTKEDCFVFHQSIEQSVVPLLNELAERKRQTLRLDRLYPWDSQASPAGMQPLKPFENAQDLLHKTIRCLNRLHPQLGEKLAIMQAMGHLDLESRKGKAGGGYNYPLLEIGVPFIFMNATSMMRDVITLLHESGHAVHNFVTQELPLVDFKHTPSEIAELASMTMELITMDFWDEYFDNPQELKRAKIEHLEDILSVLPWIALIDAFQHWLYENPKHTQAQREEQWLALFNRFSDNITHWESLAHYKAILWQKQLHIFEVPFYYIEYAMAQLGAIAIWRNYKQNPSLALNQYLQALKLGNTATIPEVYATAGIKFDFSKAYIQQLMNFVQQELEKLL